MQGHDTEEKAGYLYGSDAGNAFSRRKYAAMEWIQALEPLDSKYRLVVLLYYMEGFGIREISDILDMKESTVKSRLYRGRKQIAEMYGYKVKEGRA